MNSLLLPEEMIGTYKRLKCKCRPEKTETRRRETDLIFFDTDTESIYIPRNGLLSSQFSYHYPFEWHEKIEKKNGTKHFCVVEKTVTDHYTRSRRREAHIVSLSVLTTAPPTPYYNRIRRFIIYYGNNFIISSCRFYSIFFLFLHSHETL